MIEQASKLVQATRDSWPKPSSLASTWLLSLVAFIAIAQVAPLWISALVCVAVSATISVAWIFSRRLKRCPPHLLGFVVAISVDHSDVYPDFRRDFIFNVRNLLSQGNLRDKVWFYEVPQFHIAEGVDNTVAVEIRKATRAAFVLFGQVRTRDEGEIKHYVDLHGLVAHGETNQNNKARLTAEFSELLPRRLIAKSKSSLPAFETTSSISSVVAKYVAGIAAFLTGLGEHAQILYGEAAIGARPLAADHAVARKIMERIPLRLGEISLTNASNLYNAWRKSKDDVLLVEMERHLDACHEAMHPFPEWKTLKAVSMVAAADGDMRKISALLSELPPQDPVTQMNLAFPHIATGDLRSATKHYRKAESLGVSMDTVEEVMSFLDWYKDFRPESTTCVWFALGFISYSILKDKRLAHQFFESFELARGESHDEQSALIRKWMEEIE